MSQYPTTPRTRLGRKPERARYDKKTVRSILDEGFFCHVAFCGPDGPVCIPMVYARLNDGIWLHGSAANRALRALRDGARACVTVTLVDALVLARSAFRTSVNYRSVVIYGTAREVADRDEKLKVLRAVVEHVVPGRTDDVRGPTDEELGQVLVLRLPLEEVSAKVRSGYPADKEEDYARECWAGILPLAIRTAEPIDDPRLPLGVSAPAYVREYSRGPAADAKQARALPPVRPA